MDLEVPPADKDAAKALGARWAPSRRRWYVPEGVDPAPFLRWIPAPRSAPAPSLPGLNLRSAETYLVTAPRRCWKCGETTLVAGFLMAPGFQDFSVWQGDLEGGGGWGGGDHWSYALHIDVLPSPLAGQAIARAPRYRRAFSRETNIGSWTNHCSACRAPQDDVHLFEDPGAPFLPSRVDDVTEQRAFRLPALFEAGGSFGPAIDPELVLRIAGVKSGSGVGASHPAKVPTAAGGSIWERVRRWLAFGDR